MQAQPIPPMSEEEKQAHTDAVILEGLLDADSQRPWAVFEVENEIGGDAEAVSDSLGRLSRAGLIHRLDKFVFASRAALRADQIAQ